jgi:hypothetical protein
MGVSTRGKARICPSSWNFGGKSKLKKRICLPNILIKAESIFKNTPLSRRR